MVTDFKNRQIPFVLTKVSAGFPSPADDFIERRIDLNEVMVMHASATQIITMPDNSLLSLGIFADDYLLLDKAITPKHGNIVACLHEGEFLIGHFNKKACKVANHSLSSESVVIGVVTWAVRRL